MENHAGMQMVGHLADSGLSLDELKTVAFVGLLLLFDAACSPCGEYQTTIMMIMDFRRKESLNWKVSNASGSI